MKYMRFFVLTCLWFTAVYSATPKVQLGVELFFSEGGVEQIKGKRIGIITNHTGMDTAFCSTIERLRGYAKKGEYTIVAIFAPEHGLTGNIYAAEEVKHGTHRTKLPIYSLHGETRRPTAEMLRGIDTLIYDIQDIGCRPYTYTTTLFYMMEEAAKVGIEVIVFDRPNPINGETIDGPMLEPAWRSFLGYINVPYCHGMTIGELARFFNEENQVGCKLTVIPMRGWKREMSFRETGLQWVPTSPQIPEPDTPLYCATTGGLGELGIVSIGVGYTLPFKLVGAPWIEANQFADQLNAQKFPGVSFLPFHFRPQYGIFKGKDCQGVYIAITDKKTYRPLAVHYLLIGILKLLYPEKITEHLEGLQESRRKLFCQVTGNDQMFETICKEKYVAWKLIDYQKQERLEFKKTRRPYLLY